MSKPTEQELRELAADLTRYRRLAAPPAFRAELRASLLAAPVVPSRRPAFGWLRLPALRPVVAIGLVLALLAAGGGSAAASSLPGDPAFGLKRALEEVQVALAPDDATRLDTLVTQSDRRLGDLETAAAGRPSATAPATDEYRAAVGRLDAALATLIARPATPASAAAVARASAGSADHLAALQALAARLPASAQPGIQRAIEAQQTVHGKSGNAPGRRGEPGGVPGGAPVNPGIPGGPAVPGGGRPSDVPGGPPPGRGGPPGGVPGPSGPPGGVPGRP